MSHIPTPIRAALGLAATAVAEARKLPETLPQLPVVAVSTAMQASLRVQQHIATFAARGDEVLSQLRGTSAEPPTWATFDDAPVKATGARTAFDLAEPANLEDTASDGMALEESAPEERAAPGVERQEPGSSEPAHPTDLALATSGAPSPPLEGAEFAEADEAAGRAAPGKVPPAKLNAAAETPAKKAPAKKAPTKAPAKKAAAKRSEPLAEAASKADPTAGPNPSTMAAEILQAHQGESPDEQ